MAEAAIVAEGLAKRFGGVRALAGVSFELPAGGVLGLLGLNGAGKTTTVRILSTLLRPDGGRARVVGRDVVRQPGAVRRVIGVSGQAATLDPFLTGLENLRMIARLYGIGRSAARRRADELLERFDLGHAGERQVRTYSGGMRRRLDVAASLVAEPRVLFLDEPTTGLDPHGRIGLWRLLGGLREQGASVLLTTQYLEEADRLADRIVVIDRGRVIADGTSAELKARIGGDRLELRSSAGDDPVQLAAAVADLGSAAPVVDPVAGQVIVPIANGPRVLLEAAARLASSGLGVADLGIRRPTLEDVFLTLTDDPREASVDGPRRPPGSHRFDEEDDG